MAVASKEARMRNTVMLEEREKLQIGLDRLFQVETKESQDVSPKDVPAFRSFGHAFREIMGMEVSEACRTRITNTQEAILAATWPNILGTSMHRRLMKDYLVPAYGDLSLRSVRPGGVANFKTQEVERVKYFGDLSEFDPEQIDYPEITEPGEEKLTYAVIQKGNILTISRKAMLNDDLGAVTKMVGRLGRAARRSHARFFWNFWINNTTYEVDGLAWFHATHGNLKTQALTADMAGAGEVLDALVKLGKMTEPGSGERLGLPEFRNLLVWLVIPMDLVGVARQLNQSEQVPNAGGILQANPIYHLFGANDERLVVNALLTDVSDWGVFRDPSEVDSVEIGYLGDQREPEFFVANIPTIGQMFVADKLQYKIRHEYGGDVVDFRGAVKSVV